MSNPSVTLRSFLLLLVCSVTACGSQPAEEPAPRAADAPTMTREAFRARVGVANIVPDHFAMAFQKLPIGFYKDYHALGSIHRESEWANRLSRDLYIPVIQYKVISDTPEIRDVLRNLATSGHYPIPIGVTIDDLLAMLELPKLEAWLVQQTATGALPKGTLFLLGNEPGYKQNLDPRTPQQVVEDARIVRDIFDRNNLGHRLGLGGIATQSSAYNRHAYNGLTGFEFFEAILEDAAERGVVFDAFAVHPYPLSTIEGLEDFANQFDATDLAQESIEQIRAFRSIMARHGQRDKDVIVGELGLPFPMQPAGDALACAYADQVLTWCLTQTDADLGNHNDGRRMVQLFCWFMLSSPDVPAPGFSDNPALDLGRSVLIESDGTLTALGKTLNAVADRLAPED